MNDNYVCIENRYKGKKMHIIHSRWYDREIGGGTTNMANVLVCSQIVAKRYVLEKDTTI